VIYLVLTRIMKTFVLTLRDNNDVTCDNIFYAFVYILYLLLT
jgi:hypothetical protein